jgi:hypothetical protein
MMPTVVLVTAPGRPRRAGTGIVAPLTAAGHRVIAWANPFAGFAL